MPGKFFSLIFIFIFSLLLFSTKTTYAQTITLSPPSLTARYEGGMEVTVTGLRTDLGYYAFLKNNSGLVWLFGNLRWNTRNPDANGVLKFKVCGDYSLNDNCTGRNTFKEGVYEIRIDTPDGLTSKNLAKATFESKPTTSDITIDFLNTSWTTSNNVIVQLGKVSDGNYLITVNDQDPSSGGGCFGVNGGSVIRNIGKYFEGSYTVRIYDNGGGFPNPLCSKGSQVGEAEPFTIANDGTGGPGKAIPPQTTIKLPSFSGSGASSSGIPCAGGDGIETAIGCIPTDPTEFVRGFLRFAVGAAGGLALLIMVFGAFKMITSAGNPDSLKEGQEMFTNAIIGLLFIIFSTLLLKIIGVDILGLGKFLGV